LRVDYHTHHYRCGHAEGNLADYVEAALAAGFDEIGLSDHSPIYHLGGEDPHPRPRTAMARPELPRYIRAMEEVRAAYAGRIAVRLGVESDHVSGWEDHYRALWAKEPLDYTIGSVHWLFGDWSIFSHRLPAGRSLEEVYAEYLRCTMAAARSGAYDIIGHLDGIKTNGWRPPEWRTPLLQETVAVLADAGVAIELNASGWRKPVGECYPGPELLEMCRRAGIPVTFGSDAHRPDQVGSGWMRAVALLRDVGYREIATFRRRQRLMVPLDEH
jgi:histidinol-phosphatase (PHP family)